jgi:hypothetical protein
VLALASAPWAAPCLAQTDGEAADAEMGASSGASATGTSSEALLLFDAPEGCPQRADFMAELERILARRWSALPADLSISVRIAPGEVGFVVQVGIGFGDGTPEGMRTLRDATCRPLVLASALIVALAVDPDAALIAATTPVEVPVAVPAIEPPLAIESPSRDLASPYDRRPPPITAPLLGIGVGVALDVGLLPQPSAGPVLEGVLRIEQFDVRARATYLAPTSALLADGMGLEGVGAEVSAWLGAVEGCFRPIDDPRLAVCAGLHGGALLGRVLGPISSPAPGSPAGPWLAVGAGVWLPWAPWDALDIELSIEGLVSVVRPRFEVAGIEAAIFEPFAVGARFGLVVHLDLRP